jgi:excisionase family DNA binding protein
VRLARAALALGFTLAAAASAVRAQPEVLDLEQAAALLRLAPAVVVDLAEAGRMPARRIGDTWRFSRQALLEWLKGEEGARRAQASPREAPPASLGAPRSAPTAEEIALRDQGVLLRRGALTLDLGVSYARSERTIFPIVRTEERSLAGSVAVRYGIHDDVQVTARLQRLSRRTSTFTDATVSGTTSPQTASDAFYGDATLSLLTVAAREAVGRPNVIASLDAVLPTGPGERGIGGGVVLSKSYDPAVLFAGLSYLHGFATDPGDPRRSLAKHNFGLNLGTTYALNDSLALNTTLIGTVRDTRSPDGVALRPARERYQLQLGMTWMLATGLFVEPAVALRVGGEAPDVTFSLNVPYSF